MPGFAPTPAAALRTPDAGNAPSSANNAADPKRPFSLEGSLNPAQTALPPADAAANAADGDFPATVSEDSPEGRKRRSARRNSALSQLNTLSGREDPAALWDNGAPRDSRELIRIVPPGRGRLGTFLRYRRLQLSVANFYLGNRLRKQYQLLEDSRGESRRSPGAVRDLAGLFIEARTKGLAGRVYPLGLDILEGPALERDARALFDKFFDADEEARAEWNAYVATALISPRAKIPSQLKKALFVVLQDAAAVPKTELARFLRERRAGLEAQSDQFLPVDTQERVIFALKAAVSQAVLELNAALSPGSRLVGISLLGSYVTRTARPDSDLDFHVVSEDGAETSRAAFVDRLAELWEKRGRTEELGAFQYALATRADLLAKVYRKPGNLPNRILTPYPEAEIGLKRERSSDRWRGAKPDLYARVFELAFRAAARTAFAWWDFKNFVRNSARAAWIYHGLQLETVRFFFGTRASGLREKETQWREEMKGLEPAVKDLRGLLLHWRAEAYTGSIRPLGPQVADRRAVKEAALRIWDKFYPADPEARTAFLRYIARLERVAPAGRPSYYRKNVFQVFYETLKLERSRLSSHIDGMLDDSVVAQRLEYQETVKPRVRSAFARTALAAIAKTNAAVPHDSEVIAVVLLGSYATGTPSAKSDLDYMVVTRDGSKLALKAFADNMAALWSETEFKESPLGPFQYAVPPSRRLLERTHPEGYLVFSPEAGVVRRLFTPVPANQDAEMSAWVRFRGRLFAEGWKAYLSLLYRALDARDALRGAGK